MSSLFDDDERNLTGSMSLVNESILSTNIYLLWTSSPDDEYKMQALFGSALHHDFEKVDEFQLKSRHSIIVYQLTHHKVDSSTRSVNPSHDAEENHEKEVFFIRISTKAMGMSANYNDSTERIADFGTPHQFLFDIKLHTPLLRLNKGKQRARIISISPVNSGSIHFEIDVSISDVHSTSFRFIGVLLGSTMFFHLLPDQEK
jgi:hypothetical protein